ncbi:unnamed protein product [Rotaria sp. Silwood2]|nr:unnamed protein product [Rotaria sp. Silwood2]CAF4097589.1 unnamed protein product [Rotaria sp. Silwood2]CAF4143091.1 unnamed protein product [Rotaria sp. Silwood2]
MKQIGSKQDPLLFGWFLFRIGKFDEAEHYVKLMLTQLPSNDVGLRDAYNLLGLTYKLTDQLEQSVECYEKALDIYSRLTLGESRNTKERLRQVEETLSKSSQTKDRLLIATVEGLNAKIQTQYSNNTSTLKRLELVLKNKMQRLPENHPLIASTLNAIGTFYENINNDEKAFEYFKQALVIGKKRLLPDHLDLVDYHTNIGRIYDKQKQFQLARKIMEAYPREEDDSDILSDLPIDSSTTTYRNAWNDDHLLSNLIEANTNINYLFKDFNIPTLRNSVTTLKEINQRIVSLAENVDPSSNTVYRAQVVLTTDFKMLQDNPNTLLAIQGFILASRSSHSIVDVCRQAVDNQLNAVLLGLKLFDQASIVDLDPHTVIFSLGTLFRLISTESAPDSVWHAQLESTNGTMESITDRLRFEIGGHFTWLTFGHYLTTFKRYDAAKNYYEYLLFVLPSNHSCLPSIYNNMGLMYAEMKNNRKALEFFQKASKSLVNDLSIATEQSYLHTLRVLSPQSSFVNNIKILNKIAEISYLQGNKKTALEYYRRALSMEPDAVSREL